MSRLLKCSPLAIRLAATRASSSGAATAADGPAKAEPKQKKALSEEEEAARLKRMLASRVKQAAIHWEYSQDTSSAKVYDRKPIPLECKAGRIYMWCACGQSKQQPFCDGTHRFQYLEIKQKPVPWKCEEDGLYWFCACKRTAKVSV